MTFSQKATVVKSSCSISISASLSISLASATASAFNRFIKTITMKKTNPRKKMTWFKNFCIHNGLVYVRTVNHLNAKELL